MTIKTLGFKVSEELKAEADQLKDSLGMQGESFVRMLLDQHYRVANDPAQTVERPSTARKEVRVFGEHLQQALELLNSIILVSEKETEQANGRAAKAEEQLKEEIVAAKEAKKDMSDELADKNQQIKNLNERIADMAEQIEQLKAHSESVDALKEAHQEKENSLNAMVVSLQEENAKYSEAKRELRNKQQLIEELERQNVRQLHEYELESKDAKANAAHELASKAAEIIRLEAVNASLVQQVEGIQEAVKNLQETCLDLREDKESLKQDNVYLKGKVDALKAENLLLQNAKEQLEVEMGQIHETVGQHIELKNF
ncbi:MAG: hypothetical protein MI749_00845 [Desulfovibrionales bacterium]|nr:hypothetical protein [Desulfovibrionales bacterium]